MFIDHDPDFFFRRRSKNGPTECLYMNTYNYIYNKLKCSVFTMIVFTLLRKTLFFHTASHPNYSSLSILFKRLCTRVHEHTIHHRLSAHNMIFLGHKMIQLEVGVRVPCFSVSFYFILNNVHYLFSMCVCVCVMDALAFG